MKIKHIQDPDIPKGDGPFLLSKDALPKVDVKKYVKRIREFDKALGLEKDDASYEEYEKIMEKVKNGEVGSDR